MSELMRLMRVLLMTMLVAHIGACCMHFLGAFDGFYYMDGWLVAYSYEDEDLLTRYVYSLYWSITIVTTVGYGDITPKTKKERMFGIMYFILAGGLFSVIIGSMNSFIENLYAADEEFEK